METEILHTLQEIRGMLYLLLVIVCTCVALRVIYSINNVITGFKIAWDKNFIGQAGKMFERAQFEKLVEYCKKKLIKYPNHASAIWWLARAKLELGKQSEAQSLFERVLEIEPSWKETHINPYLKKISNE